MEVLPVAYILSSNRHYQFTRPGEPPFPSWFFPQGESVAHGRAAFKGFELSPRISCWVHGRTFVAVLSLHRIMCHAVCVLHPSIIQSFVPQSPPSVVPGARDCRCHFRSFHRRQQLALPLRECRVSHVSNASSSNEVGRTAYMSKAKDVGDPLHRRSWTAIVKIDLRIYMVSLLPSPGTSGDTDLPGLTWIHKHYRRNG